MLQQNLKFKTLFKLSIEMYLIHAKNRRCRHKVPLNRRNIISFELLVQLSGIQIMLLTTEQYCKHKF